MDSDLLCMDTFKVIVESAPLVSIDLVVKDSERRILVGKRVNRPAMGYWFVPGGRIRKGETLVRAFSRITASELGVALNIKDARYLGLYEHFYDDSVFSEQDPRVSTHYIVNGFEVMLPEGHCSLPFDQHNQYKWLMEEEFCNSDDVHLHSRWYLYKEKGFL